MKFKFAVPFLIICICLSTTQLAHAQKTPTPNDVITALKAAGLEAESPTSMTSALYGAAPQVCNGIRFLVPSIGEDAGGRAFVCERAADRDALAGYYTALGKQGKLFFSWVFVRGNVLLQINGNLSEQKARLYEKTIEQFGSSVGLPVATLSPVASAQVKATQAYAAALLVKGTVIMTEELAIGINKQRVDSLKGWGGLIAVTAMFSATYSTLQSSPPAPVFAKAWVTGNTTIRSLQNILSLWLNKKIDSAEVLKRLPSINRSADDMVKQVQDIAARQFKMDRLQMQKDYENRLSELRNNVAKAMQ